MFEIQVQGREVGITNKNVSNKSGRRGSRVNLLYMTFLLHPIIILHPLSSSIHAFTDILPICTLSHTLASNDYGEKNWYSQRGATLSSQGCCTRTKSGKFVGDRQTQTDLGLQFQDFATPEALWEQIWKTVSGDQSPLVINGLDNHPPWNINIFDFNGIKATFDFGKAERRYLCFIWCWFSFAICRISILKV